MKNIDIIKKYVDAAGPSGFESEAYKVMNDHLDGMADEIIQDKLGSLVACRKINEDAPNVMIAGHLDEIGFLVTNIDENGYLSFQTLGGWWSQVMVNQRVHVVDNSGKRHLGIIISKTPFTMSPAERDKALDVKGLKIDIGVKNKEAAEKLGIQIGDFIVPECEFTPMANEKYLMGKAFDNRIGCYIAAEVMIRLKKEKLDVNLFSVGTVQEEVGVRGAKTSANLVKPDIGFALDVGLAADIPGSENEVFKSKLGEGPQIALFDAGMIGHVNLRKFVVNVAKECNINIQYSGLNGGSTDAAAMHISNVGAPSLYVGLATRYIHSNASILHYDDIEDTITLLVEVIKQLNKEKIEEITYN